MLKYWTKAKIGKPIKFVGDKKRLDLETDKLWLSLSSFIQNPALDFVVIKQAFKYEEAYNYLRAEHAKWTGLGRHFK